jgi:hypothetical protein
LNVAKDEAKAAAAVAAAKENDPEPAKQAVQPKKERIPVNQLSVEDRERALELARTTSSGQGQHAIKGEMARRAAGGGVPQRLNRMQKRIASKVLYFIDTSAPTVEQYNEALAIGPGTVFRNARKIVLGAPLENCDGVAGPAIPDDYGRVFPLIGEGGEVTGDIPDGVLVRPNRSVGFGLNPDDVRPGTVDTGLAHASGTGSSQPGVRRADPTRQGAPNANASEARQLQSEWKNNKTPGGSGVVA